MGTDPAVLAQFSAVDGLEWFHLPIKQRRPFVLPDVGLIAVAEHPGPIEGRIRQARLFVGLCVWGRGQLEAEVERMSAAVKSIPRQSKSESDLPTDRSITKLARSISSMCRSIVPRTR